MPAALLALLAAGAAAYAARRSGDPKKVFFSFHYADIWQVNHVKNSWVTQPSLRAAGFFDYSLAEAAKTRGAAEVRRLIDNALEGTEVTVVLIGSRTHSRKWVRYEVEQSALRGNGLLGIDISGLRNRRGGTEKPGESPFSRFALDEEIGVTLDEYVPEFDWALEDGYRNFRDWVRTAPTLRDIHRDFERDFG